MAAGNGFLTVAPDVKLGSSSGELGRLVAQKFVCGGTGAQQATQIGAWGRDAADTGGNLVRLAIFTHDATNNCPDTMVADSETGEISSAYGSGTTWYHLYQAYSTKPQLTGGDTYWIIGYVNNTDQAFNRNDDVLTTGDSINKTGTTYPTWPTGDDWHTHTDRTYNISFYAVYEAAATTKKLKLLAHSRRRNAA